MKISALPLSCVLVAALTAVATGQTVKVPTAPAGFGQQTVAQTRYFVVDPAGGGDFQEIAQAAAVAPSGSSIRVLPGTYTAPIVIRNKTIQLIADEAGQTICTQQLRILNVDTEDQVLVSGLDLELGFEIGDCAGQVTLQDCITQDQMTPIPDGPIDWTQFPICGIGGTRHLVRDCDAVTVIGCAFEGAPGRQVFVDGMPGHHGLVIENSTAALYGCELTGGEGAAATSPGHFPANSGAGGDGLQVRGASSTVHYTRLDAIGGLGGTFTPGGNGDFGVTFGCDGDPVRVTGGVATESTHPNLAFGAPTSVQAGSLGTYSIVGTPGAPVYLSIARSNEWTAFGPSQGILHLPAHARMFPVGILPPSGALSRPFPVPAPSGAGLAIRLELQLHAVIGGVDVWSEPRSVLVRN